MTDAPIGLDAVDGIVPAAKRVVLALDAALDAAPPDGLADVLAAHTAADYRWRGVHPFDERDGVDAVVETFWQPLRRAIGPIQRRRDLFFAGRNDPSIERGDPHAVWVCQSGHLMGLFDEAWLDIRPTRRMLMIPYAEFQRVDDGRVAETAMFVDLVSVMRQAGHDPLPPQTGASMVQPGPMTHDGLLVDRHLPDEGRQTLDLVHRMVSALSAANGDPDNRMPREVLAETWHDDMIWWGPEGIGATYTIDRYQQQHQYPFRMHLDGKRFNGHVARIGEGNFASFFGWANLTNTAVGGFLGMTGGSADADMRVVDLYRRDGDKLAENWVFIDLLHWLNMQGLDVLARMRQLNGTEEL